MFWFRYYEEFSSPYPPCACHCNMDVLEALMKYYIFVTFCFGCSYAHTEDYFCSIVIELIIVCASHYDDFKIMVNF